MTGKQDKSQWWTRCSSREAISEESGGDMRDCERTECRQNKKCCYGFEVDSSDLVVNRKRGLEI